MRYYFKIILFISMVTLGWSCGKTPVCDCFDSAGKEASQVRVVPYFTQVTINDNINAYITIGYPEQLTIEGGGNLISNIGANVSGEVLSLKNNNICNWLRSYKKSVINVYITMPQLTNLTNSGYGTIQSQGVINVDSLMLITTNSPGDIDLTVNSKIIVGQMFGTADLTLTGQCQTYEMNYYGGTGFIYNSNLAVSNYLYLSSNSTGDSYINCASGGYLQVVTYGQGNVYYSGAPSTVQYASKGGSGQLIKE